jgi:hypothetical protein
MKLILTIFCALMLGGCAVPQKQKAEIVKAEITAPMMAESATAQISDFYFPNFTISLPPSTGVLLTSADLKAWSVVAQLTNQDQVTLPMDSPSAFFRAAITSTSLTLEWNASTDPVVAGYNVYSGGASGTYTNMVNAGSATRAVVFGLIPATVYYFAATTYAASGMESSFSDEFRCLVPAPRLKITK